ncbi:hypothetical protein CDD81_5357 [Ophiocordyceps australis]|uniref:Uncharacterized protein n=1 Tax=Ophiocordyceps australis TaxID=1399860 RepID=A0A2C5XA41_9HYPO|nr:hypothetical protein CDD81_5357 [Ophiocordyceps australis]
MHSTQLVLLAAALASLAGANQTTVTTSLMGESENNSLALLPWLPPSPKAEGDAESEKRLGTKAYCRQQTDEAQCLKQREKPVFLDADKSKCKTGTWISEPCMGTVEWCKRGDIMKEWKLASDKTAKQTLDRCVMYRNPPQGPKDPWLLGSGCSELTEACLGSDSLCVWYHDLYTGQEECFLNHEPRPAGQMPFKFRNSSFFTDSEFRNGTEAMCLAIKSNQTRFDCFRAREKIPFQIPFAPGCPAVGGDEAIDERCFGSAAWCERLKDIYGSAALCLSLRTEKPKTKLPWRTKQAPKCDGLDMEACLGTEAFCVRLKDQLERRECFALRETAPLLSAATDRCAEETCVGTVTWCSDRWNQTGYYNTSECFAVRDVDPIEFMNTIMDEMDLQTEQILVTAALKRANVTMMMEALKNETQDSNIWMKKGVIAGRKLFRMTGREGYLHKGIKRGIEHALEVDTHF